MISNRTLTWVVCVVTTVWVLNIVAVFLYHHWHPVESVNGIFTAVVGGSVAMRVKVQKDKEKKEKENGDLPME